MTPEEAVKALDAIEAGDPEENHGKADDVLLATVPPEVAAAWNRAMKRDGHWWWA